MGKISKCEPELILLRVQSLKELETVRNHFQKFPLITKKRADYKLFQMVIITIKRKEHLTYEGLRKIVAIRAAMNWGLSEKLNLAFADVVLGETYSWKVRARTTHYFFNKKNNRGGARALTPQTIDPQWLAGFTSAEGCFLIMLTKSKTK